MFILGDMIRLGERERRLPLPWWHRAPLAFETDTQVFVTVSAPEEKRPGDILVSVLDPNRLPSMLRASARYQEGPGIVAKAFESVADLNLNIALAETATVDGAKIHRVDLICEPTRPAPETIQDDLDTALRTAQLTEVDVSRFRFEPDSLPHWLASVNSGWVSAPDPIPWRETIRDQAVDHGILDEFDLGRLVLSADTERRLLRYLIPRKGARTVTIRHADEPGALGKLTSAIASERLNILSSLLKRGGALRGDAVLVAVCEPTDGGRSQEEIDAAILEVISRIDKRFRARVVINGGLRPSSVIYSRHRDDVVTRVPDNLKPRVIELRNQLRASAPERVPVFVSRRFIRGPRASSYADKIEEILARNGCRVVSAPPLSGGISTSFDEVSAAMWASRAAVVLVAEPDERKEPVIGLNLPHEFGFMQGQGKPLLLLVENSSRVLSELSRWSNVGGITAPRFDRTTALTDGPGSIKAKLEEWVDSLPNVASISR